MVIRMSTMVMLGNNSVGIMLCENKLINGWPCSVRNQGGGKRRHSDPWTGAFLDDDVDPMK